MLVDRRAVNDRTHSISLVQPESAMKINSKEDQFFWAIGRFVSAFSDLELTIKTYIANAINLPDEYFTRILSHDFAMLCTMAQDVLCREADEDRKSQLKALINRSRKLNDHCVRIVHGWWRIGHQKGSLLHVSRQRLEVSSYYRDASEIANLADEASNLCLDLWEWARGDQKPAQSNSPLSDP